LRRRLALALALPLVAACKPQSTSEGVDAAARGSALASSASVAATASPPAASAEAGPPSESWIDAERRVHGDAARGKALVAKYECNRCHEGSGLPDPRPVAQCAGCHAGILAGTVKAPHADNPAIHYYVDAPRLSQLGQTLRGSWLAAFLIEPGKVAPHRPESMPRMSMTASDARDVAAYLVSGGTDMKPHATLGDAERGMQLAPRKGCFICHEFTGAPRGEGVMPGGLNVPSEALARGVLGAPDLRLARERVRRDTIVDWIKDPHAVRQDATMPTLGLSTEEAADLAAYVLTAPLDAPPAPPPPRERLPVLERKVIYEEVAEKVFRTSCIHCHENGGPGNTGGFGFAARGVDVTNYRAILRGYVAADGSRASLLDHDAALDPLGGSRLVAALVSRFEETAGRPTTRVRGMPMGLPPLSPEQIQLVESWVTQGAKSK
jgi:cytochrome c2